MTNEEREELEKQFPCNECIVLAICLSKYSDKIGIACEILYSWITKFGYDTENNKLGWKQVRTIFSVPTYISASELKRK